MALEIKFAICLFDAREARTDDYFHTVEVLIGLRLVVVVVVFARVGQQTL